MVSPLQNRSTGNQLIADALSARRTVRVTYCRSRDDYRVDVACGDDVAIAVAAGIVTESRAEGCAAVAARVIGLDVTRVDVP
jgi:hypothetical protein